MADEARLEPVGTGVAPVTDGWFVVNARDAAWMQRDGAGGRRTKFELDGRVAAGTGLDPVQFDQVGYSLGVVAPGEPSGLYHAEAGQEDFLVLAGECIAIVEEEERRLEQWDFLHCPPWTRHVFVGAGDGPCVILMAGARVPGGIVYPVSEVAARYGASVDTETRSPDEAYAPFGHWRQAETKPEL
jgi:uncharacterized cupin superfamily protein